MTTDSNVSSDDVRPRTWADAFPWLTGVAEGYGGPWWDEPISEADPATHSSRLATIADVAIERLTRWTIGQVFAGLPADIDLLQLNMPVRAVNVLGRSGCHTSGRLAGVTVGDMLDWRRVGVGTVSAILQALADVSTSLATPDIATQTISPASSVGQQLDNVRLPEWVTSLCDDVKLIAMWYCSVGQPAQAILGSPVPPGTPDHIIKARLRLEALTPSDIMTEDELTLDVAGLFDNALGMLDPRAVQVLGGRFFADDPMTLDQLGTMHGVTRERIRQIESKARGAMLSFLCEEGPLADVAASARDLIGTIRPLDDLLELVPALTKLVGRVGQPAWRVLDRLDDAYEIEDGWCVVPSMTAAVALTNTQLQERSNEYGVIRLDEVDLIESTRPGLLADLTASWLIRCDYVVHGDFALTRTSSVGDYAAAVLSIEGSPLSAQEIVDRFVFDRSVGSTRNAMSADNRFERVDRDRWALKEWGIEAYAGIRSIIRELVARDGGRARIGDVVEYITARYSVSGSSVVAYAAAAPFMTRGGIVSLAGERTARKAPEHTRRLFRWAGAWAYRVQITTDHLRGSGSVAPMAVATILGLQSGQTVQLSSRLGPQCVAWTGIQPSFGTIRRFLMDEDVSAGIQAFLVIHDDGRFTFEQVREPIGNSLVDALSLIGVPPAFDGEQARVVLAAAIGLSEDAPASSIIGGYRARGDDDIAELLIPIREHLSAGHSPAEHRHRADVDEILDLL